MDIAPRGRAGPVPGLGLNGAWVWQAAGGADQGPQGILECFAKPLLPPRCSEFVPLHYASGYSAINAAGPAAPLWCVSSCVFVERLYNGAVLLYTLPCCLLLL